MTHRGDLMAGHSRIPKERCAEKQLRPDGELGRAAGARDGRVRVTSTWESHQGRALSRMER